MTDRLSGRCHCNKIQLDFPVASAGILTCHCGDCRKMHGNFNAFVAVAEKDVHVTGKDHLVWYQSSETSRRAFCRTCGSRIVKEVSGAGRWLVSAGLIDGPTGKQIIKNLWEQSKPDWYALPEVHA